MERSVNDDIDQRMAQADLELQQMGEEALQRMAQSGAKEDDIKFVAWLAGLEYRNADSGTGSLGR